MVEGTFVGIRTALCTLLYEFGVLVRSRWELHSVENNEDILGDDSVREIGYRNRV